MRHRLTASVAYDLPFSGNVLVDDWQVQAVGTWETGRPFTVAIHPDIDASNTGRSNLGFGYNDRPNVSGDPTLSESDRHRDAVVQDERVLVPGLRHVRQLRPQHARRAQAIAT